MKFVSRRQKLQKLKLNNLSSRVESNHDRKYRKLIFYPLNYERVSLCDVSYCNTKSLIKLVLAMVLCYIAFHEMDPLYRNLEIG